MNNYVTLDAVKRFLHGLSGITTHDSVLMEIVEQASRQVDSYCGRHFYTFSGTRYFSPTSEVLSFCDDLVSITTLEIVNPEDSGWTDATITSGNYELWPHNKYPKVQIKLYSSASENFINNVRSVKVAGVFGYSDGAYNSTGWESTAETLTTSDASTTTATAGTGSILETGQTILAGSEQLFIEAISGTTLTVKRAANGTTGATHTAADVSGAAYPQGIINGVLQLTGRIFSTREAPGAAMIMVDGYQRTEMHELQLPLFMKRIFGSYKRSVV